MILDKIVKNNYNYIGKKTDSSTNGAEKTGYLLVEDQN
jgi:hypothetical protein